MKQILSFIICLFFSVNLFSQGLDTTVTYEWVSNAWQPSQRNIYTNNAQCLSITILTQNWQEGSSTWADTSLTTNTYTASEKLNQSTFQQWNGSVWENSVRFTYNYNANDLNDSLLTEIWQTGSWENGSLTVNSFNADQTINQVLTQAWFGVSWFDLLRQTYTYNADKTVNYVITETNFIAWTNSAKNTYTYNGSKQQITDTTDTWDGTKWVHDALTLSTYSGSNLTNMLIKDWVSSAWVNDNQINYTFNGDGTLGEIVTQDWVSSAWVNENRTTLSYSSCTLPLTLLNFTAAKKNNLVDLSWQTTDEINTSHFSIQRSSDGTNFKTVGNVNAAGNGSIKNNYSFSDNIAAVNTSKVYYRLQMFDKDGMNTFSKIIPIDIKLSGVSFSIKPNPAHSYCTVVTNADNATMTIVNLSGKVVFKQTLSSAGEHKINVSAIAKGMYIARIVSLEGTSAQKLVIE
ncbi:hypothetical protein BH10BAC2_BH10BAC2_50170 [soil metagenome]